MEGEGGGGKEGEEEGRRWWRWRWRGIGGEVERGGRGCIRGGYGEMGRMREVIAHESMSETFGDRVQKDYMGIRS